MIVFLWCLSEQITSSSNTISWCTRRVSLLHLHLVLHYTAQYKSEGRNDVRVTSSHVRIYKLLYGATLHGSNSSLPAFRIPAKIPRQD